jgi:hypothetical protein
MRAIKAKDAGVLPVDRPSQHLDSKRDYLRFPFSNDPGARRRRASLSARTVSLLFPRSRAAFAFCLALRSPRRRFRLSRLSCKSRALSSGGLSISEYSPTGAPAALDRLIFSSRIERNASQLDLPMCQLSQSRGSRACDVVLRRVRKHREIGRPRGRPRPSNEAMGRRLAISRMRGVLRNTLLGQKSSSNPRERDRSRSGSNALLRSTASVWPPSSSKSAK